MPKAFLQLVKDGKVVKYTSKVTKQQNSQDGTIKMLVELQDGLKVESVIMRYDPTQGRNTSEPDGHRQGKSRYTLCVSSQARLLSRPAAPAPAPVTYAGSLLDARRWDAPWAAPFAPRGPWASPET